MCVIFETTTSKGTELRKHYFWLILFFIRIEVCVVVLWYCINFCVIDSTVMTKT